MPRWLRQTDTLVMMTLAVGVFVFRFGNETWAAVTPHLVQVHNTLSAQFDRVTTSLASIPGSVETEVISVETPVISATAGISSDSAIIAARSEPIMVLGPSCGFPHAGGCRY